MNAISKILAGLLLFTATGSYGQMERYAYMRELKGVSDQWHRLTLDDAIFGKLSNGLDDIRIFGITAEGDTVEAPYLMQVADEKLFEKEVSFRTFNASHNENGFYFTFELPGAEPVNEMGLEFANPNFDWRIKLEGSHDQQGWFTVLDNYRILSIRNGQTDFQFTKLVFPESKYRFFRLSINSSEQPKLLTTNIIQRQTAEGKFREYPIKDWSVREDGERQTAVDLILPQPVPVSRVGVSVSDTFDYYRPVEIQRLIDSVKTEQGWRYNFVTIYSGVLHSLDKDEFAFESAIAQRLRIRIHNHENQPLQVSNVQVRGYVHELVIRFTQPATYYLVYGNSQAVKPAYDITRFEANIPMSPALLELGTEQTIQRQGTSVGPLFVNKGWL